MGVFDRLGDVIRSYLNDAGSGPSAKPSMGGRFVDPDLEAAYEELDGFLAGEKPQVDDEGAYSQGRTSEGSDRAGKGRNDSVGNNGNAVPPESLRRDFDELGLPFGASGEACKAAYKRLLKLHHPDRHAGHEGNMKKATEKAARLNVAYDRIEKWRQTGQTR